MVQRVQSESEVPPKWGPGYLRVNSIVYRLEMLLIILIILVLLFYWRLFVEKDLNVFVTVFWLAWPDLASFIPIGLAARGSRKWPKWGPSLYNFFHTFLVAIPLLVAWSLIVGSIQWPMLGWLGHITMDRTVGYYLRAKSSN